MFNMTKYIGAGVLVVGLLCSLSFIAPAPAQAASLTSAQVQAIIGLLQSFGADQSVINNVSANLNGQATSGTPSSNPQSCNSFAGLKRGDTDSATGGQVSQLQQFLNMSPVGVYGPLTQATWKSKCGSAMLPPPTGGSSPSQTNSGNQSSNFTATPISGSASLAVTFTLPSTSNGVAFIDFGDGKNACGYVNSMVGGIAAQSNCNVAAYQQVPHTYTSPGTYIATLKDSSGNSLGTATITITGNNSTQPSATIDQSSLTTNSQSPTITGTGQGTGAVEVEVSEIPVNPDNSGPDWSGKVSVQNGVWSFTPSNANAMIGGGPLSSSYLYKVLVWLPGSNSSNPLASGTLTVQ